MGLPLVGLPLRDYVSLGINLLLSSARRRSATFPWCVRVPGKKSNPWGSVLRVICVTIEQSYNRGCTIARWLRRSLLTIASGNSLSIENIGLLETADSGPASTRRRTASEGLRPNLRPLTRFLVELPQLRCKAECAISALRLTSRDLKSVPTGRWAIAT